MQTHNAPPTVTPADISLPPTIQVSVPMSTPEPPAIRTPDRS